MCGQKNHKTTVFESALGISGKVTEAEGSLFPVIKEMRGTGRILWPGATQGPTREQKKGQILKEGG